MNKTVLIILALFLHCSVINAQSNSKSQQEKVEKNNNLQEQKDIDSLIRDLRDSFYAKDYVKTIDDGKAIIEKAKPINYNTAVYTVSSILGNTFLQLNDTIAAVKIIKDQLEQAEVRKDSANFLGASIDLGNIYFYQGKIDKALTSFKFVLPHAKQSKDTIRLFILNYNISEIYLDKKNSNKSEFYVNETGKYIDVLRAKPYHAGYELILGRLKYLKNNPKEAIVHLSKAIEISNKINYTECLIKSSSFHALASAKLGDFETAYKLQQKVDLYKEEKYNTDKIKAIETVTAKFNIEQYKQDIERKELKNKIIEQEANRNETKLMWVSFATVGLLLLMLSILYSYFKRKKLLKDLKERNIKYLKAKEKSEELAIAKSLFFSNISHELRTPLYGIIGLSSILMDDKTLDKHREDVKSLKFSADYLLSLINDVLQISKLDSKQENKLNKKAFNLKDLLIGIMKSFEFLKVQNMNTFNIKISEDIPNILIGDDVKLSQILINIIGNACKFTENGIITVNVGVEAIKDDNVTINFNIKDTGIGIEKSKQEVIFNEFAQVENRTKGYQGTGLGLPIVKKLLEIHKSKINLISEEGKGTEISFKITYDIATETSQVIKENLLESKISIRNKTILVVDDNRINRIVTKKILEKYKAKPLVANGGLEAIEFVKNNTVELILMDINMPEMNGLEATEAIRLINPDVPVIALTAVEIEEMKESIQNSTICDIIVKPYDEVVFIETILKHI
ncbi:phospho-acceptor domain-containing protein [Lacinutrix venerupis]|uniref:ATP-binding response regulator n=1 Tax=Lacinutrix venerupis TaxID=1486034 RepID=UPI000EB2FFF9|nr:ATP-binding protein [Lacinutrix venerupis]RLJ64316.1 phospho-acceptor domain-containing protein [Lacinutrix venerupis]